MSSKCAPMIPENSMQKQQTKYLKEKHVFPDK